MNGIDLWWAWVETLGAIAAAWAIHYAVWQLFFRGEWDEGNTF